MKSFATHFQSGTISSNETDGYGNSDTHFITGNVIIDFRDTFTIQARSFVIFDFFPAVPPGSDSNFGIRVIGKIYAVGTSSVYFTFNPEYTSPENGGKGFQLADTNTMLTSLLKYCILEYARNTDRRGGGAISIVTMGGTNTVTISGGTMYDNRAYDSTYGKGGGIFAYRSAGTLNLTIHSVKIQNNTAANNGGGIHLYGFTNPNGNPIYNCLIANNTAAGNGGGIYMDASSPKIYNCTVSDNTATSGDGVYSINTASPVFINDIIYPDEVLIDGNYPDDNTGRFQYCDLYYWNYFGPTAGNLNSDPQFTSYGGYDYLPSLNNVSPCIDKGLDNIPFFTFPTPAYDLRGSGFNRKVNTHSYTNLIDMGAFEYQNPNPSYKITKQDSIIVTKEFDDIIVYPNPVNDYFYVRINSETEEFSNFSLFNNIGEVVFHSGFMLKEGENLLHVSRNQLPSGIYILSNTLDSKIVKILFE